MHTWSKCSCDLQLQTAGLLGPATAQRAGKQLGTGGHASCRMFCTGGACAPGMGAAMGGAAGSTCKSQKISKNPDARPGDDAREGLALTEVCR